jgi:hypothetical protein
VLSATLAGLVSGMLPPANAEPGAEPSIVRTESGRVRCAVSMQTVVCQATNSVEQGHTGFLQAPMYGEIHWDIAEVTAAGKFDWDNANIPGSQPEKDLVLGYDQTYDVGGWTILPTTDGTRFTNARTGHGMFVSIGNVYSF